MVPAEVEVGLLIEHSTVVMIDVWAHSAAVVDVKNHSEDLLIAFSKATYHLNSIFCLYLI